MVRYKKALMDEVYEQSFETDPPIEPIVWDAVRLIKRLRAKVETLRAEVDDLIEDSGRSG